MLQVSFGNHDLQSSGSFVLAPLREHEGSMTGFKVESKEKGEKRRKEKKKFLCD